MAEKLGPSPEKHERKISPETPVEAPVQRPEQESRHETPEEHEKRRQTLERKAEQEAKSRHETPFAESEEARQDIGSETSTKRALQGQAYGQLLQKVRANLKPAERTFSKFIHQPTIETVSEISGKTVARPSGILGGGLVALLGTGAILYMAKHYGFEYNFFVYVLLFAIGFLLGVTLEFVVRSIRPKSQ